MTPVRKTTGILVLAAAVACAALLLTAVRKTPPPARGSTGLATNAAGLSVRAYLQSSHLLVGTHEAHVAVTIDAPKDPAQKVRPAMNVAIVIDHSGSMAGEKLEHARQAAQRLVSLLSPRDRFAIIGYGSEVEVVFPSALATEQAKDAALAAIQRIYDDGGTNLSGGLTTGRAQILANPELESVARIVLISDGLANEGIVGREELAGLARDTASRGISITTVGVGLDFDERTMTQIAVSGRGNYYFVESSAMLAELFATELEKLGSTTATQVRVAIAPAPGVEILEAYGYPIQVEGGRVLIPIADLHSGEQRKVVLRTRVNAEKLGAMDLGAIHVTFLPTGSHEMARATIAWRAEVTDNQQLVLDGRDPEGMRYIERALNAKAIDEATVMYEQGDQAAAMQVLEKRRAAVKVIANELDDADLFREAEQVTGAASGNFAAAPARPTSTKGKRAQKANRANAYDLMH